MRQLESLDEIAGKTIRSANIINDSQDLVIVFTDDTFTIQSASRIEDDCEISHRGFNSFNYTQADMNKCFGEDIALEMLRRDCVRRELMIKLRKEGDLASMRRKLEELEQEFDNNTR